MLYAQLSLENQTVSALMTGTCNLAMNGLAWSFMSGGSVALGSALNLMHYYTFNENVSAETQIFN